MNSGNNMETIFLDDYLEGGILIEKMFREKVNSIDWSIYKNKKILIKGCASVPIPTCPPLNTAAYLGISNLS